MRRAIRAGNGFGRLFSGGGNPPHATSRVGTRIARLSIARQNSRPPPSSAALRPFAVLQGANPSRPPLVA